MTNPNGRFGIHGGQYIPETLMNAVIELEEAYNHYKNDPEFNRELTELFNEYAGRPSRLYYAEKMTKDLGGAKIYLKREDLNHTGAHKINNVLGQALLAQKMGKTRLIAETGAGQHGVATATAAMEVKRLFDTYGDPTSLAQTEESGVLHNLIQDLKALDAEKARLLALTPWINNLENKEKAFKEAAQKRTDEKSRVIVGVVKQCRSEADNAYRQLVSTVNALCLIEGEEKYTTFIDHVNVMIDERKTILRTRSTINAKKNKTDMPAQ